VVKYTVWHKPVEVIDAFVEFEQELQYVKFLRALCDGTDKCLITGWEAAWSRYCGRYSSFTGMERVAELCVFHYEYRNGIVWDETTCSLAATAAEPDILRFLHEHGCCWDSSCCTKAAESGSLECLQYAHEHGCPWDSATCATAAGRGSLDCLKYAHEHGCPWDARTCEYAVTNNKLTCLRYAHESGCPWGPEAYRNVQHGSACHQYLRDNGCPEGEESLIAAVKTGHLGLVQPLHEIGCVLSERVCHAAVEGSHLHILKYLHEHGCPWSADICTVAAELYYPDCLQYLRENGAVCSGAALASAASNLNSTKCFRYLLDAGCGTEQALAYAAMYGNGEALLYALQKGCTGARLSATYAAQCGSLACLKYVHEQGGAWDEHTCDEATTQFMDGRREKLACLKYAHEHGCPWSWLTFLGAVWTGDLACLQYAHEHGCPMRKAVVEEAANAGSLSCLKYLHEQGCEWPDPAFFASISKTPHNRKCLEYAAEHPEQRPAVVRVPPADCPTCASMLSAQQEPAPASAASTKIMQVVEVAANSEVSTTVCTDSTSSLLNAANATQSENAALEQRAEAGSTVRTSKRKRSATGAV
jgi:hypothetical protein